MEIRTETRTLICDLTESELVARGDEMAKTYIQVAALDMQKKRISAQIKPLDERIEELVSIIYKKQEGRKIKCEWQYEWALGVKRLYRPDTGELIDSETIREGERQMHLRLTGEEVPGGSDVFLEEDPEGEGQSVCWNEDCSKYSKSSPNGCSELEHVYECEDCKTIAEAEEAKPEATE